jgi:hypothetical protein
MPPEQREESDPSGIVPNTSNTLPAEVVFETFVQKAKVRGGSLAVTAKSEAILPIVQRFLEGGTAANDMVEGLLMVQKGYTEKAIGYCVAQVQDHRMRDLLAPTFATVLDGLPDYLREAENRKDQGLPAEWRHRAMVAFAELSMVAAMAPKALAGDTFAFNKLEKVYEGIAARMDVETRQLGFDAARACQQEAKDEIRAAILTRNMDEREWAEWLQLNPHHEKLLAMFYGSHPGRDLDRVHRRWGFEPIVLESDTGEGWNQMSESPIDRMSVYGDL